MKLTDAKQAFLSRCYSQNLSELTIEWYARRLKLFLRFLAEKSIDDVGAVTAILIRDYLGSQRQKGIGSETIYRDWGAMKCFFRFIHREKVITENPMDRVEQPRREKHIIKPMNMEQVRELLSKPDLRTVEGKRDKALMLLMVDSGLRVSEAISVQIDRIDWTGPSVTVMGKGRKERTIPLGNSTAEAMREYEKARKKSDKPLFFLSRRGHAMNNRYVQVAMRKYGKMTSITGIRISPHTLRHTFATQYIKNGGDVFSLQNIIGHSRLDMVRIYVNLAQSDVATQHRKFSPIDYTTPAVIQHVDPATADISNCNLKSGH